MSDDDLKKIEDLQLTQDEIKILKAMVEGQRAMTWLKKRSGSIAAWLSVMVGAYLALTGQLKQWLQGLLQGG